MAKSREILRLGMLLAATLCGCDWWSLPQNNMTGDEDDVGSTVTSIAPSDSTLTPTGSTETADATSMTVANTGTEPVGATETSQGDVTSATTSSGTWLTGSTGVESETGSLDCETAPDNPDCTCTIPDHVPCDNGTQNLFNAMGLNCPGELQVNATSFGNLGAFGVRSNFGQAGIYNAREGSQFAVLGSGLVSDLIIPTAPGDSNLDPTNCNDELPGNNDVGQPKAPIKTNQVGGDCTQNPALLGTGDCSNTLQAQFNAGGPAFDYAELRFTLQVPPDITSFSYDFAFFTVEYPGRYNSQYNDMYIGWLNSEKWTGNISFDDQGEPISLNAGFLEFKDDGGNSPVLAGTCMRQHAGTNWLQTTAGVTPGETITVVFAIFDLSDPHLDSYVFIDNFRWGCEPGLSP